MGSGTTGLWTAWRATRDDAAFEKLVRPVLPALYDAARRAGLGSHDAEDVVQESLTELARERGARPGQVGVGAWLMRSVRLKSLGASRSTRRRRKHEGHARSPRRETAPDGPLEIHDEVERALCVLAEGDRQILLFRYLYDLDYREIAYVLGVSENACRIRVHRASGRLRDRIGHRAPTMLALLPLCDLPNTAGAIAVATKVAGTTAGAWAALTGGLVMGTGLKMAGAAAAAAALTAGVFLTTQDPPRPAEPEPAYEAAVQAPDNGDTTAPRFDVRAREVLADLEPSTDELAWLKERLKEERARRSRAAVRAGDSGIDILRRVIEDGLDPWPLLADFARFSSHVRTGDGRSEHVASQGPGPTSVNLAAGARAGVRVVEFGPGTFEVKNLRSFRMRDPIQSLEFRGAGMDETVLRMGRNEELMVTKQLTNLRFRDLTIDYGTDCQLLDVRDATAAILERVRIRNWASGGYSAAIGVAGRAYLGCRDCEFEHTEDLVGQFAVNFRGRGIAVFERCTFRGVRTAIIGDQNAKGSQVLVEDCTFLETALTDSRVELFEKQPALEIRVRGATVLYGARHWDAEARREGWGAHYAAELTNVSIEAHRNSLTPPQLAGILRSLELPREEFLYSVDVRRFRDDRASVLRLNTVIRGSRRSKTYACTRRDGAWVVKHNKRGGGHGYHLGEEHRPRDLISLLEGAVPADLEIRGAHFQIVGMQGGGADEMRHVPALVLSSDRMTRTRPIMVHAETGEVLSP